MDTPAKGRAFFLKQLSQNGIDEMNELRLSFVVYPERSYNRHVIPFDPRFSARTK